MTPSPGVARWLPLYFLIPFSLLRCHAQVTAYSCPITGPRGVNANNSGLNIGHTFSVVGTNIQVIELGVYNYLGQGLASPHAVTLFSDSGNSHTPLASVTVPVGTSVSLKNGFRYVALNSPLTLPPGNYSVIAYQLNGLGAVGAPQNSDPYADAGSETSSVSVNVNAFTIYEFTTNPSPAYPTPGAGSNASDLGSASFTYVDPAASSLTSPVARQVVQRNTNNVANIPISGTVTPGAASVKARAVVMSGAGDNGLSTSWQMAATPDVTGAFSGSLTNVTAGGWYRIEVQAFDGSDNPLGPLLVVEKVGVGDVYVTGGQSNSCSFGQDPQQVTDDHVSTLFIAANRWSLANDPQPNNSGGEIGGGNGSPWPHFGSRLATALHVPIGIVCTGYGGTALDTWLPNTPNSHYPTLQAGVTNFPAYGFKAFLWHQGESDAQMGTPASAYAAMLNTIIAQSRADAGWIIPWGVAQASYLPGGTYNLECEVNAGQRLVAFKTTNVVRGARTDDFHLENEVSALDGIHFNTAGLTDHANQWVDLVLGIGKPAVKNGDFTAGGPLSDGTIVFTPMIGWTAFDMNEVESSSGSAGYYNPDHTFYTGADDNGPYGGILPNMGSRQVAFFNGNTPGDKLVAQLPAMLAPHSRYILTVAIGVRNSGTFGGYQIALTANNNVLAQISGSRSDMDALAGGNAAGTFNLVTLSYESPISVEPNQALDIQVIKTGGQIAGSTDNGSYLDFGNVQFYGGTIAPPEIILLTTNVSVPAGAAAHFLASVTGVHPLLLQWYQSADGGATFTTIQGQTNTTLAFSAVSPSQNGYLFRLFASNDVGTATSPLAHLTVVTNPGALSVYGISPVPITADSYNFDMIIEKEALVAATSASVDSGTSNTLNTWFERGYYAADNTIGLPPAGSTITSSAQSDHSYKMPSSYTANNAVLINSAVSSAILNLTTPTACSGLSFLASAGYGPAVNNYVVNHADGTSEIGSLTVPDWFASSTIALTVGGRVDAASRSFQIYGAGSFPYLLSEDIALTNTSSPVTSIALIYASGGNTCLFALSGSTGGGFSPISFTGYNQDMVIEAGAQHFVGQSYTTASMDSGTANLGASWYEVGYSTTPSFAPGTGVPFVGSAFTSQSQSDHHYKMAPTYVGNDVCYVDASNNHTITLATPNTFWALSFLTAAGHGPGNINYTVHHSDTTTESGTFVSPDWFGSGITAWAANGRVDVANGNLDTSANGRRLLSVDIGVWNTNSPVTSVDLGFGSGNDSSACAAVFALSGAYTNQRDAFSSVRRNANGSTTLSFSGIPGYQYALQFTPSLVAPILWQNISTNTSDSTGVWQFTGTGTTNGTSGFYRALYLP
ncbi:MAG: hypothetical protein C5B50_26210 [Verrucomicrobia bacterium]|nr:MAG: hypothetical protein C5B50_26210 [Verrucomicrobiota bacterium]